MSQWLAKVYEVVDAKDTDGYVKFFAENCRFRFGNAPAVHGRKGIKEALSPFFESIKALKHRNMRTWSPAGFQIVEAEVTYTRHDGSTVTVPAVTIYRMEGNSGERLSYFCRHHAAVSIGRPGLTRKPERATARPSLLNVSGP